MNKAVRGDRVWFLTGLAVALLVVSGLVVLTRNGIQIGQRDAPVYLSSAESLAAGDGYVMPFGDPGKPIDFAEPYSPVVDFPSGYPAVLAIGVLFGITSSQASVVIGSVALAVVALGFSYLAGRRGLGTAWHVVVALTACALVFSFAMSGHAEPLYALLLVVCLLFLIRYLEDGSGRFLVLATLCASLAVLVRTIGLALVATAVVVAWVAPGSFRARAARGAAVALVGLIPFAFLLASGGSRALVWIPRGIFDLKILVGAVTSWFVPPIGTPLLRTIVLGMVILPALVWVWAGRRAVTALGEVGNRRTLGWLSGATSAFLHFFALLASMLLFDAQNRMNRRLLLPVALSLLVAAIVLFPHPTQGGTRRARMAGVLALIAAMGPGGKCVDGSGRRCRRLRWKSRFQLRTVPRI